MKFEFEKSILAWFNMVANLLVVVDHVILASVSKETFLTTVPSSLRMNSERSWMKCVEKLHPLNCAFSPMKYDDRVGKSPVSM